MGVFGEIDSHEEGRVDLGCDCALAVVQLGRVVVLFKELPALLLKLPRKRNLFGVEVGNNVVGPRVLHDVLTGLKHSYSNIFLLKFRMWFP